MKSLSETQINVLMYGDFNAGAESFGVACMEVRSCCNMCKQMKDAKLAQFTEGE